MRTRRAGRSKDRLRSRFRVLQSRGSFRARLLPYRLPIVICLCLVLAWAVTTRSLGGYLARTSPEVAYWLRASPTALLNLADDKLNADAATQVVEPVLSSNYEPASREASYAKGIQSIEKLDAPTDAATNSDADTPSEPSSESGASNLSDADYRQIGAWAKQALRYDPLNARALRILAQLAEHASDERRTEALMRGAAQRSSQESLAIFWMMRQSYRDQDYAEAIRYADMLLRTRPRLSKHVFPMLGRMAEKAGASGELTRVLANESPLAITVFQCASKQRHRCAHST